MPTPWSSGRVSSRKSNPVHPRKLAEIRRHVALPVGVGFGIRDTAGAQAIAAHADAVVIGSRIIQEMESGPAADAASRAGAWLGTIRQALDAMERKHAA